MSSTETGTITKNYFHIEIEMQNQEIIVVLLNDLCVSLCVSLCVCMNLYVCVCMHVYVHFCV